jgi:hypothetical protein
MYQLGARNSVFARVGNSEVPYQKFSEHGFGGILKLALWRSKQVSGDVPNLVAGMSRWS